MENVLGDMMWFRLLAGLCVGLALGSFITMLSYRLPRHLSIISPPSQCPSCHTTLKPRDLVPVLSWLIERGHCRHCHAAISRRYLVIEVITTLAVVAAFWRFGFTPHLIAALIGIVSFITLVFINYERHRSGWR